MAITIDVPPPHEVGRASYSSSPGLSSPPSAAPSPTNIVSPSSHVLPSQNGHVNGNTKAGGEKASRLSLAKSAGATVVKKARKKREPYNKEAKDAKDAKEGFTKARKSRPSGTSSSNPPGRRKKVVDGNHENPTSTPHPPRQSKITDSTRISLPPPAVSIVANPPPPQNGNSEVIVKSNPTHNWPAPKPRSTSGQNYDPIRSATIESRVMFPQNSHNAPVRSSTPPRPQQKYTSASASPSIASLIDPSNQSYNFPKLPKRNNDIKAPGSPNGKKPRLSPPAYIYDQLPKPASRATPVNAQTVDDIVVPAPTVELDMDVLGPKIPVTIMKKSASTCASSTTHSPKPSRPKQPPISLPSGNGLLSSAMFGGAYDGTGPEKTAPTVILNVSLDGGDNKYVNFARMAEERYGFNALHPRLAAQRERLARVAAAGAAIENAHKIARNSGSGVSADEMSVDLSENDGGGDDSNIEMGGTSYHDIEMGGLGRSGGEGSEATLVKKAPKKRLMKEDYYDKDDPFVDDAELAWEEQAAASKDGFFVYSGLLVPEGEKPNVERYILLQTSSLR